MKLVLFTLVLMFVLAIGQQAEAINYFYLTDSECAQHPPMPPDSCDVIRFFGRDTLWGPARSNDCLAFQNIGGWTFCTDTIYMHCDSLTEPPPSTCPIVIDAPVLPFPTELTHIREAATEQSAFFHEVDMQWRGVFDDTTLFLHYYPIGSQFDSLNLPPSHAVPLNQPERIVVLVDGKLDLRGQFAAQGIELILGCSSDIRLIDDVMIAGTDMVHGTIPGNASSRLALASEGDIIVADTWENGRANRTGPMADHADIVITALIYALNGSFTFEDMNDVGDDYVGPMPDERGNIVMTGGVTQSRRGYVHRSNNGGTGYNKVYHFDGRLINWSVGVFEPFDIEESVDVVELPTTFSVSVFPNPFNATAVLRFNLARSGHVKAKVFDLLGREITTLSSGVYPAGEQSIHISGAGWGSGLYFVRVDADGQSITQKVMLLK